MTTAITTVCILDADPAVRDSLEVLIDLSDLTVRSFASIHSFLGSLESINVGCLLCAAEMPDGNGIDLFVRLDRMHAHFPFALLISENRLMTQQRAIAAGILNIFRKPIVNPASLLQFIQGSKIPDGS